MRRDYARYQANRFPPPRRRRKWLLLLIVFVLLLGGISYTVYTHRGHWDTLTGDVKAFFSRKKALVAKSAAKPPAEEAVHFDFYTELPNIQVTPAVIDEEPAPRPNLNLSAKKPVVTEKAPVENKATKDPEAGPQFILQIGVFQDVNGASQSRLSLLLSGCESEIVKISENGQAAYRVQQGPFLTEAEAKAAQKKLQRSGVQGTIKKIN